MKNDLNKKLSELKDYSRDVEIKRLNKRIYDLDLNKEYLKTLTQERLQYIHVRFHTALSYKKPFAEFKEIKKVHDIVAKLMKNHQPVDKLDYSKKRQNI